MVHGGAIFEVTQYQSLEYQFRAFNVVVVAMLTCNTSDKIEEEDTKQ